MTAPRFPAVLGMTAVGLTAFGDAPVRVALAFVMPGLLTAVTRSMGEVLVCISRLRSEVVFSRCFILVCGFDPVMSGRARRWCSLR